jgi:hypothetical protein
MEIDGAETLVTGLSGSNRCSTVCLLPRDFVDASANALALASPAINGVFNDTSDTEASLRRRTSLCERLVQAAFDGVRTSDATSHGEPDRYSLFSVKPAARRTAIYA